MKTIPIVLLAFLLSACTSPTKPDDVVAVKVGDDYYQVDSSAARSLEGKTEDRVMCTRRAVVGSNKKVKTCTTASELETEQDEARRVIDRHRTINAIRNTPPSN